MRFDRVKATAFGGIRGRALEFTPTMTVVHGPNEAGKSTRFAAVYAVLVGRRVSRGRGTKAQSDFRRRHKPWVGSQWLVELTLTLDSGRQLLLKHDLQSGSVTVTDSASVYAVLSLVLLVVAIAAAPRTQPQRGGARGIPIVRPYAEAVALLRNRTVVIAVLVSFTALMLHDIRSAW